MKYIRACAVICLQIIIIVMINYHFTQLRQQLRDIEQKIDLHDAKMYSFSVAMDDRIMEIQNISRLLKVNTWKN